MYASKLRILKKYGENLKLRESLTPGRKTKTSSIQISVFASEYQKQ